MVTDFLNPKQLILPNYTTTERDAMVAPPNGTIIFNTTTKVINYYNNYSLSWRKVTPL